MMCGAVAAGACCAGVLDAGGFCCASGRLDACGVCDGDASSCALRITARIALNASAWAARPGGASRAAQQGQGGAAARAPPVAVGGGGPLGGSSAGAAAPGSAAALVDTPDGLFVNGAPLVIL